jgi:hypothetical protein
LRNLSRTVARGIDLNVEQQLESTVGTFRASVQGAYLLSFSQAVTDSAPLISVVNTVSYPTKVKGRGTLSWMQRPETLPGFSVALSGNYTGRYIDNQTLPAEGIASYSTVDAKVGYSTGTGHHWLENGEIVFSATNLFNASPPFVNNERGYDQANTPPLARILSLSVTKQW